MVLFLWQVWRGSWIFEIYKGFLIFYLGFDWVLVFVRLFKVRHWGHCLKRWWTHLWSIVWQTTFTEKNETFFCFLFWLYLKWLSNWYIFLNSFSRFVFLLPKTVTGHYLNIWERVFSTFVYHSYGDAHLIILQYC